MSRYNHNIFVMFACHKCLHLNSLFPPLSAEWRRYHWIIYNNFSSAVDLLGGVCMCVCVSVQYVQQTEDWRKNQIKATKKWMRKNLVIIIVDWVLRFFFTCGYGCFLCSAFFPSNHIRFIYIWSMCVVKEAYEQEQAKKSKPPVWL